ncbi:hypothetical protein BDV27DRAFT_119500 [Aspergillus caelatus]|uniref:Uncharacterized protein n=1 Tax=Aspergillus caelatus TaxID=61420 RepID=A0A5N7AKW8_9EURO|nr:uncharacterized protein BDV27DRAFT_119500 [Aspergillus caelatus]KAE8370507.1 hypothetical protein BDV27DRAFT_119500 [Aspergillus caelatus]
MCYVTQSMYCNSASPASDILLFPNCLLSMDRLDLLFYSCCELFDRYTYMLPEQAVKKRLRPGELGYKRHGPQFATIAQHDNDELRALELVRGDMNTPVPKLIHQGNEYS